MKIEKGRRVTLKIELNVYRGQSLEKSTVEFIQGAGTLLAGLEKILEGLEPGAKREGVLEPKEAFGNPATQPVQTVSRKEFPKGAVVDIGETFAATDPATKMNVILRIEDVNDNGTVQIRKLHALHDKRIEYKLEVVKVSDPAPPPLPAKALKLEEEI